MAEEAEARGADRRTARQTDRWMHSRDRWTERQTDIYKFIRLWKESSKSQRDGRWTGAGIVLVSFGSGSV